LHSGDQRNMAADLAWGMSGVRDVIDGLTLAC
jgi:osmotically-inducible protein OsmY